MDPNWDDLKVLLALRRGGSVAAAARTLNVDHSTVSRRLASVEEALAAQLLVRGGREFAWTAEGEAVLAAAEAIENLILSAMRAVRTAKSEIAGTVKVATTPSMLALLAPVLPPFQQRHPALDFEFVAGFDRVDLARGAADIAVRVTTPTEPDLVARFICDHGLALYASKAYADEHGLPADRAALSRHHLVLLAERLHRTGAHLRWLEDYRDDGTAISRVDNFQSAEQLIALGRGIGSLPVHVGDLNPRLRRVFDEPHSFVPCYVVYHASQRDAVRIRAAADVLTAALESLKDTLSGRPAAAKC